MPKWAQDRRSRAWPTHENDPLATLGDQLGVGIACCAGDLIAYRVRDVPRERYVSARRSLTMPARPREQWHRGGDVEFLASTRMMVTLTPARCRRHSPLPL